MAASINRHSLSSTQDDADLLVLAQPGLRFTNLGDLSTAGARASAILIDADDIALRNFGTLAAAGDAAPVISVGDRGDSISGVSIYNHGLVESIREEGTAIGILLDSHGDGAGGNLVVNFGAIDVAVEIRPRGIVVLDDRSTVINRGTITAHGEIAVGISLIGSGNSGANYGTILVRGEAADGVILIGENQMFENWGTIDARGSDSIGVRLQSGEVDQQAASGTLINHGTISGEWFSVWGSPGAETLINHGSLVGDVSLHAGSDLYVAGRGGTLAGSLSIGQGHDLIVVEQEAGVLTVADFSAGAGSDDVLDLRALGIDSFAEVIGHAREGADALTLDFGTSTLVLANVTLASLSPDDFLFDGAAIPLPEGVGLAGAAYTLAMV